MKDGVLPTLNLPVKSHCSKPVPRSSSAISKREQCVMEQQIEIDSTPKPCYTNYAEFVQRTSKLKLNGWNLYDNNNFFEAKYLEPTALIAKYQIFVNQDLSYTLRCYGWTITNSEILQLYPSFNMITFSDFIKTLNSFKICEGI